MAIGPSSSAPTPPSTRGRAVDERLAVCFDLDGVLTDTMPLHAKAWQEAAARFGLRVDRQVIYAREGEPGLVTARDLLAHREAVTKRAIAELLAWKERSFKPLAVQVTCHPRVVSLIERLSAREVSLALVTGTSRAEVNRFLPMALQARFDAIVTGDRVRHGKPHPEPYRTAFRRLHVSAERTLVVENAPYGIRSARRAGAGFIIALASSLPPRFLREADAIVRSVSTLCDAIEDRVRKSLGARHRGNGHMDRGGRE